MKPDREDELELRQKIRRIKKQDLAKRKEWLREIKKETFDRFCKEYENKVDIISDYNVKGCFLHYEYHDTLALETRHKKNGKYYYTYEMTELAFQMWESLNGTYDKVKNNSICYIGYCKGLYDYKE